jgi:hypothetical protein
MEARAYRVKLHFSLHCHLLPYHHLFLHCHFLLYHGLAFFCENAGVVTLRRQRHDRLDRFGSPDISIGHSDVHPGVSRRGRQKNNGNQEKLAHRRLQFDDGDSLSVPGMKLCDLGHPSRLGSGVRDGSVGRDGGDGRGARVGWMVLARVLSFPLAFSPSSLISASTAEEPQFRSPLDEERQ